MWSSVSKSGKEKTDISRFFSSNKHEEINGEEGNSDCQVVRHFTVPSPFSSPVTDSRE